MPEVAASSSAATEDRAAKRDTGPEVGTWGDVVASIRWARCLACVHVVAAPGGALPGAHGAAVAASAAVKLATCAGSAVALGGVLPGARGAVAAVRDAVRLAASAVSAAALGGALPRARGTVAAVSAAASLAASAESAAGDGPPAAWVGRGLSQRPRRDAVRLAVLLARPPPLPLASPDAVGAAAVISSLYGTRVLYVERGVDGAEGVVDGVNPRLQCCVGKCCARVDRGWLEGCEPQVIVPAFWVGGRGYTQQVEAAGGVRSCITGWLRVVDHHGRGATGSVDGDADTQSSGQGR